MTFPLSEQGVDISDRIDDVKSRLIITEKNMEQLLPIYKRGNTDEKENSSTNCNNYNDFACFL